MNVFAHCRFSNLRTGFTLIELLVVIGIIALLIGILLPVLAIAKQTAIQVHCSAQVRQICTALELYANDFHERYPLAGRDIDWDQIDNPLNGGTGMVSWMQQLYTYIPSQEVLSGCHTYPRDTPYHYFLSARAVYAVTSQFGSVNRVRIQLPSAFVLTGDNTWEFPVEPDADKDDYTQPTLVFTPGTTFGYGVSCEPQHAKGLNVGFADSHVALFNEVDLYRMTWRYDTMSGW